MKKRVQAGWGGMDMCGGKMKSLLYIGRRMPRMELPGKMKQGRPKTRFMGAVREDTAVVDVTEKDAEVYRIIVASTCRLSMQFVCYFGWQCVSVMIKLPGTH